MILCVSTHKGGTGKTTVTAAMAQAAAYNGQSVLAIDLDQQMSLSFALGASEGPGSYEMLQGTPARKLIQEVNGIHIIRASRNLGAIASEAGSGRKLEEALKRLKGRYDLIVMDTPTAGLMQYSALQAATDMLIPMQAEPFALQGLHQVVETAALIQRTNPDLKVAGVFVNQYDGRTTLARQMNTAAQAAAAQLNIPYLGTVRKGIAVSEAQALQRNMFSYAPRANAVQDFMALYQKIMGMDLS